MHHVTVSIRTMTYVNQAMMTHHMYAKAPNGKRREEKKKKKEEK